MRALCRKTLYRPGPCRQALHKQTLLRRLRLWRLRVRRLRLPNSLLILNPLILENDLMKDGQTTKKKMLVNLWAENVERINSSQARKAYDDIAKQMNLKFGTKRATEKFHKKIKYLIERYKNCKDWNSKQTGGHLRKSSHFDEIDAVMSCRDIVTLNNVKEAGSAVSEQEETVKYQGDCVEKKEARTSRKKTKKRERERGEEGDNEDRKMFRAAFEGLETQRKDMNTFVNNFSRIQEQQLTTMNALVGALSKFLEKQYTRMYGHSFPYGTFY